jgi:hypothetical protein
VPIPSFSCSTSCSESFCEVLGLLCYCPSAPYPSKILSEVCAYICLRYIIILKGTCRRKDLLIMIDPEGSQIQHVQRNNTTSGLIILYASICYDIILTSRLYVEVMNIILTLG